MDFNQNTMRITIQSEMGITTRFYKGNRLSIHEYVNRKKYIYNELFNKYQFDLSRVYILFIHFIYFYHL